jgi:hypothetical protein
MIMMMMIPMLTIYLLFVLSGNNIFVNLTLSIQRDLHLQYDI